MIMETPQEVWVHALYSRTYERVRLCVHAYTNLPNQHTLCCEACISFSSRGQYVPVSQMGLQHVENAELLFRLKHQQLL